MNTDSNIKTTLVNVNDSVLVIIDMQDCFFDKYPAEVSQPVLEKAVWLIKVAQQLNVPVVAMAEDIEHSGNLNQNIKEALSEGVKIHNKNVFGLGEHPEILRDIEVKGRGTAVLIGMETDVCVAHSALHLMAKGYRVVVIRDAVATTGEADQEVGLGRMRDAGAAITSVKGIYYEWNRSVDGIVSLMDKAPELEAQAPMQL